MGNSLRDQLLKAGLATKKQASEAKQNQYKKQKQQRQGKETTEDESKQLARQAIAEQAERNRQLNRQWKEKAEEEALTAQIAQLVEQHRLPSGDGDQAYNFADESKIKRLYVSKAVRDQLSRGQLAIVRPRGRYEVVPADTAEKIRERRATAVVLWNEPKPAAADDPYAEFPIPDDLDW